MRSRTVSARAAFSVRNRPGELRMRPPFQSHERSPCHMSARLLRAPRFLSGSAKFTQTNFL